MDLLNVANPEPEGDLLLRQTFEILGEIDDTPQVYSPNAGSDVDLSDTTVTTRGYSRSNHAGSGKKNKFSKNLISERKRRQKLNEKLYSLRAIVPKITKMDKASIMADAIDYVQELKAQVTKMGREISAIESTSSGASSSSSAVDDEYPACRTPEKPRTELQMEVEKLDEYRTCMVRFRCSGKELMEIVRALETLDMEVINATISTFQGQIFTNYMTKVRDERLMEKENLEGIVLDALKHTVC